ncbi:MAG TPA: hypothetical protein V6D17_06180 [Candidatus Obscuribacterales bacterium]
MATAAGMTGARAAAARRFCFAAYSLTDIRGDAATADESIPNARDVFAAALAACCGRCVLAHGTLNREYFSACFATVVVIRHL